MIAMKQLKSIPKAIYFQILLASLCYINLEYMHYTILTDRTGLGFFPYIENICFTFIDVCLIFAVSSLVIGKKHYLFFVPYGLVTFFIAANVWYSRYFYNYLPPSLYTEFDNLDGLSANIFSAIKFNDVFLIASTAIGIGYYWKYHKRFLPITFKGRARAFIFLMCIVAFTGIGMLTISTRNWPTLESKYIAPYNYATTESNFKFGILHSTIVQLLHERKKVYTKDELKQLQPYFQGVTNKVNNPKNNIILIIVESLLSYATELRIGEYEITPNLNKLVKDGAYYNRNMTSNIQLGESSDGQFIYLTGLLPKQQGVTIIDYFNNTFKALPFFLKKKNPSLYSTMTIPTASKMWRQDAMCDKYNIKSLYSRKDYQDKNYKDKWLDDKTLFECAAHSDITAHQPFFSILLTSSTHTPYTVEHAPSGIIFPECYPEALKVYLSDVHYMDKYLGEYIASLKSKGIYDDTLIIVTSDHPISKEWFHAENMAITSSIPLYIINSPVPIDKGIDYPISQADVFPTLLDLAGIESSWRGVGNSLLTQDSLLQTRREMERKDKRQQISDIILDSNFFHSKFDGSLAHKNILFSY